MPSFLSGLLSSLQVRLALGFVFALAVALALIGLATGSVAGRQAQQFERDRDSAEVARVQRFISDYYANSGDWDMGSHRLQEMLGRAGVVTGSRIVVYDIHGNVVADSHVGESRNQAVEWREKRGKWKGADKIPVFHETNEVGAFTVASLVPSAGIPRDLDDPAPGRISGEVKRSLLWASIGAAALGTLLVWLLSRRTLTPLRNLGATARRLGRGDFSQRAEDSGPTEIRELASNFNAMAADLEEAERQRRNLTADVAHELRTPLSNIQGYLEAIRDGLIEPSGETIDTIHGQATQLSRLVDDLRLLAQVESGDLLLERSPVQLEELLQSCADAVRPRAAAKNVSLDLDIDPALPSVEIDGSRISQVVGNLLENAITHTPQGGRVTLSGAMSEGMVTVSVADTGPGIAPDDLSRIFDRFYRADPSRARATGGSGLGLTIARRLVEAHGGTIEAESTAGEGSRFTVRLPAPYSPIP